MEFNSTVDGLCRGTDAGEEVKACVLILAVRIRDTQQEERYDAYKYIYKKKETELRNICTYIQQ